MKNIINAFNIQFIGLSLDIIGVLIVGFVPKNPSWDNADKVKYPVWYKFGWVLIVLGFSFQLIAMFLRNI